MLEGGNRLVCTHLAGFDLPQYGIQLLKLYLVDVDLTEAIGSKGPTLLRRFHQPLQHRVGSDLTDSRGRAHTEPLSQAGQPVHNQLH